MSCCVKSSFLRSLAEQKGQKSMLIKGCGQLLACSFALIKTKCSCSRKTLQIYSSNSAHWLWGEPVGFWPFRALTKKSQHFPPEVWGVCVLHMFVCSLWVFAGCACGHSTPWAFLFFHILSGTPPSHSVSPLLTWGWSTGHPSMLNISLKIHPPDGPCPCSSLSRIACIFCLTQEHRSFYSKKHIWFASGARGEFCVAKALPLWWKTAHVSPNCWWAYFYSRGCPGCLLYVPGW